MIWVYVLYLPLSIATTFYVARQLFNNGKIFLKDIFHGQEELANAVNKLLLVGFYLLNIGYILLTLKENLYLKDERGAFELLASKLGFIIIFLGVFHFANMLVFFRLRKRSIQERARY
jgi:hypothetical protein